MNYNQFIKTTRTNFLQFLNTEKPVILHIVPEIGSFAVDTLFMNGIQLTNCFAFVSKSQQIKLGIKSSSNHAMLILATIISI